MYYRSPYPGRKFSSPHGLAGTSTNQIVGASAASAAALAPVIASQIGLTVALGAAVAIPIVGAVIAGVGFAIIAILNSGCGQPCVVTTGWANQAEAALQKNIAAYFAIPVPRPESVQTAALANFDVVWNALVNQCDAPSLGDPGRRCISDRQAGACVWHQATTPPWGNPVQGACWNWFSGYRDPIANDTDVESDSFLSISAADANLSALAGSSSFGNLALPLAIGAGLLLAWVVSE